MEMKTVKTYKFSELDEKVQEKLLDKNRYYHVEDTWWYESTYEDWKEKLECIGFENPKIYFSGFSSQGDGAVFDADVDHDKVLSYIIYDTEYSHPLLNQTIDLFEEDELYRIEIVQNSNLNRYSHENTRYVTAEHDIDYDGRSDDEIDLADEMCSDFIPELINDLRKDLCFSIYRDLENAYEYLTSDEYWRNWFEEEELFLENGTVFNPDWEKEKETENA